MNNYKSKNTGSDIGITEEISSSYYADGIIQALHPLTALPASYHDQIMRLSQSMAGDMSAAWKNSIKGYNYVNVLLGIGSTLQSQFNEIGMLYANKVASLGLTASRLDGVLSGFAYQKDIIQQMVTIPQTALIGDLQGYLSSLNIDGCVEALTQAFSGGLIFASDLAFVKSTDFGKDILGLSNIPDGVRYALSNMNVLTSKALEREGNIVYDVDERKFLDETERNYSVKTSVQEMNSIGYAVKTLNSRIIDSGTIKGEEFVTVGELMDFMTVLSETRTFASEHIAGRKIFEMIKELWERNEYRDLERKYYYHARALGEGDAPYVYQEMLKAPHGVTGPGRYNYPGEAYYYTADTEAGAEYEVRLHNRGKKIQIVTLRPNRPAKLLDLSVPMRWGKEFLKHIRFDTSSSIDSNMPREYLIPNYVSDCCRRVGYDGIKYYGGKEYNNYVTWQDGFYGFVSMRQAF